MIVSISEDAMSFVLVCRHWCSAVARGSSRILLKGIIVSCGLVSSNLAVLGGSFHVSVWAFGGLI